MMMVKVVSKNGREEVQEAIFNEVHWKRYNIAEEAPFSKGYCGGTLGTPPSLLQPRQILTRHTPPY